MNEDIVIKKSNGETGNFRVSLGGLTYQGVPEECIEEVVNRIRTRASRLSSLQNTQSVVEIFAQIRTEEVTRILGEVERVRTSAATAYFSVVAASQKGAWHKPPSAAEFLMCFLLPRSQQDAFIGDLNEGYQSFCDKFGKNAAAVWYWKHAICSCWPLLWQCIVRLVQFHHWMAK